MTTRPNLVIRLILVFGCLGGMPLAAPVVAAQDVAAGPTIVAPAASEETPFDGGDPLEEEFAEVVVADPFEGWNRAMFWFNDRLYVYLLKPIARGYRVVPEPARVSVSNFFSNLGTPVRFVSAVLQLKFQDAGNELLRFAVNTTLGIGGLFDPAQRYGNLRKKEEDFGQTLGRYGVGPGPYLVLPFLGPANARDAVGRAADLFLDPFYYLAGGREFVAIDAFDTVNATSLDKDTYEAAKRDALDPYLFIRDGYTQMRAGKVRK